MLEEIKGHVRAGRSFAFETTLSGLIYARLVDAWVLYDNSGERPVLVEQESEHEI